MKLLTINNCEECPFRKFDNTVGKGKCRKILKWIHKPLEIHPQCPLQDTTKLLEALEHRLNCIDGNITDIEAKLQTDIILPYKVETKLINELHRLQIDYELYNKLHKALGGKQ